MAGSVRRVTTGLVPGSMQTCACGQDLDVCLGRHCTRCGRGLDRRHAVAA
jgi:hypothetical protein